MCSLYIKNMDNKTDLRLWAKSIRKTLPIEKVSTAIVEKIRQHCFYKNAKNVMLFYPLPYEINLLPLLEDDKSFYLPKVSGENLFVCPFTKGGKFEVSSFNIKEPCSAPINPACLDLIIVPALAADKSGFRLGYGGGFYDRFLSQTNCKTILPIARQLLIDKLPSEKFDIPVDLVITD